jgi:signal transduction histidine kinase
MLTWVRLFRAGIILAAIAPRGPSHGWAAEPPVPLTTLRAIADSFLEPGPHGPVDVEAVVTGRYPLSSGRSITLRDDTGATFATPLDPSITFASGDRVRVRGTVVDGVFTNGIGDATLDLLGHDSAPVPRPVQVAELATGAFHHDLVTVSGVVRSVRIFTGAPTVVMLNAGGSVIETRHEQPLAADEASRLVDAEVRLTGFGAGEVNAARHLIRPYVRVVDAGSLTITRSAATDPFAAPLVPLERAGLGLRHGHRVKVVGVATARGGVGGGVFLASGDHGLFVVPAGIDAAVRGIGPGDLVEAVGFATPGVASITLGDAVLRVSGTAPVPPPVAMRDSPPPATRQAWRLEGWKDALPITSEIDVLSRIDRDGTAEIVGTTPVQKVVVRCLAPQGPSGAVPGSRVRVRGVCRVTKTDRDMSRVNPIAFDVWPASAADVTVVRAAPWWMRPGVGWMLTATLAATVLTGAGAATWVAVLRRQVRRQVGVIEGQLKTNAALEERQRIAREFHDTLEQDLAGLALRLDAAASGTADDAARGVLERQRSLVSRLQAETRQFVWDLREPARTHWSFDDLLAAQIEDQRAVVDVPIQLRVEGEPVAVPLAARHHLLRIVREAVANAARHGQASTIDVVVTGGAAGRATVEIADDGIGFDLARCERKRGHFGIRGMRERARRIGATLAIDSRERVGSRLTLTLGEADEERKTGAGHWRK